MVRFAALCVGGLLAWGVSACAVEIDVSTEDTSLRLEAADNLLAVISLEHPETHRQWIAVSGKKGVPLIESIDMGGRATPAGWRYRGSEKRSEGAETVLRFVCEQPSLELASIWRAWPGGGPIEHHIEITNRTEEAVLLPLQPSLALATANNGSLEHWWVERGAATPSEFGTHHSLIRKGFSSVLVSTPHGGPIPWMSVQDEKNRQGWYAGIEFSGDVQMALADEGRDVLQAMFGLGKGNADEAAAYRTRVQPGATFVTPTVFVGCYAGDVDDGANRLRRWVERRIRPQSQKNLPLLVNNSWGDGMAVDEAMARRMIDSSADLGLEMYHIDAGWYRHVGDWRTDPGKFPNGLAGVADYAKAKGLLFGLWVAWSQGGDFPDASGGQTILSAHDPAMKTWFPADYDASWKNAPFTGATVCLGEPKAVLWAVADVRRCVGEYKVDLLEHDQPQIVQQCSRTSHLHTASPIDVTYHAALGYYRVQDAVRKAFPELLFEDCCDGGHLVDYGILRRTHYVSITDTYDPLSNRRAFYDSSYALPPAMCECYIENRPGKTKANFLYMLRSGMMGWCTVMADTTRWSPEQRDWARAQFTLYKKDLRPLIQIANLYHVSERPDGKRWDGMQYFDPATGRGVLFAFRGSGGEDRHVFRLKGLQPDARYRLRCEDGSSPSAVMSGQELLETGVTVMLSEPESSELVHIVRE